MVDQKQIYYGADYNLNVNAETIKEDMRLMKRSWSPNYVSINIFGWVNIQQMNQH